MNSPTETDSRNARFAHPTATCWVRCEDEMPRELSPVIVWWSHPGVYSHWRVGVGYHTGSYLGWRSADGNVVYKVSHWMPLPSVPNATAQTPPDSGTKDHE